MIPVGILCIFIRFSLYSRTLSASLSRMGRHTCHCLFGFVPVGCTYYVMCRSWTWNVTLASLACGLIIDTLLMVNNYRDRDQDAKKRKENNRSTLGSQCRATIIPIFGIGCRMALFIVYSDRTHLGCIITPTLSVTSLHGMAKNGKNQKGKRIKQHIGRNLP